MDTVPGLLDSVSGRHGRRQALAAKRGFRTIRWTYSHLIELSFRVAAWIRSRGVGKGDRVLIQGPNSPEWVAAYFGCLRAGAVVVPLDMRSAPDFVRKVVRVTEPKLAFA